MKLKKLDEWAEKLKIEVPAIVIALHMPETPFLAKILAALTIGYAMSPIDLIPDFIPVLGYLDDLLILPGLAALTIKLIPDDVMEKCREEAVDLWQDGKPKNIYCAIPIILIWALIILLAVRMIIKIAE
ncbi:MAG: YkvA family protein [Huintestinicola sp.]